MSRSVEVCTAVEKSCVCLICKTKRLHGIEDNRYEHYTELAQRSAILERRRRNHK